MRVPSWTLPEILDGVVGEIGLVKMDIEGSEHASLLTAPIETPRRIRRVAMESHPLYSLDAPRPHDPVRHLEKPGLAATAIHDHGEGYGTAYFRRTR